MKSIKVATLTIACALIALPAVAQQSNSNNTSSTSNANANNSAGAAINQRFEASPDEQTINTTPGVYPPAMDAGTNNCAISMSGGGSVTGFGISFGATMESEDCNERNWIALMSSRGWDDVAKAYACLHNAKMAMAFEAAGYECPEAATAEQRSQAQDRSDQNEKVAQHKSMPSYCSDGGMATDETIRKNCPPEQAERLIRDENSIW